MRLARIGVGIVFSTALVLLPQTEASAVELVGNWDMEEGPDAPLMIDESGHALHGQVGPDVVTGETTGPGTKGYRFKGDWWVVNDDRLVQFPDVAADGNEYLDPGNDTFAVELRIKTGAHDPNIIQKGQSETSGGMWKFVLKKGWPRCHFRDDNHNTAAIGFVNSPDPETKVDDNTWHVIRCERALNGVRVSIDPGTPTERTKFFRKTIGDIDNDFPMTLGGKLACNFTDVTCDYYAGVVDWVKVERP